MSIDAIFLALILIGIILAAVGAFVLPALMYGGMILAGTSFLAALYRRLDGYKETK